MLWMLQVLKNESEISNTGGYFAINIFDFSGCFLKPPVHEGVQV